MSITQDEMMMQEQGGMAPPPAEDPMAQQQAQMQQIAATAPTPDKPYTYKKIEKFSESMNDFVSSVDEAVEIMDYSAPEGEKKLDGPLPGEVYVPFVLIMEFVKMQEGGDKYYMAGPDLVSDTALSKAVANFKRAKKDKKLMEALKAPAPGEQAPEEEPEMSAAEMEAGRPPVGRMSDEDEAIAGMM